MSSNGGVMFWSFMIFYSLVTILRWCFALLRNTSLLLLNLFIRWRWQTEILVTYWWNISTTSGWLKYVKRISCLQNSWFLSCRYPPLPPTPCEHVIFLTQWSKPHTTLTFYSSHSPVYPGLKLLVSSACGCVFMKGFNSINQYPNTFQFKIFLANLLYQLRDGTVINLYSFALFMAWHVTGQQHRLGPFQVV